MPPMACDRAARYAGIVSAQWSADAGPRTTDTDVADWVMRVVVASAARDDAAYAAVRWLWTRCALAGLEARTELAVLTQAAAGRRERQP